MLTGFRLWARVRSFYHNRILWRRRWKLSMTSYLTDDFFRMAIRVSDYERGRDDAALNRIAREMRMDLSLPEA